MSELGVHESSDKCCTCFLEHHYDDRNCKMLEQNRFLTIAMMVVANNPEKALPMSITICSEADGRRLTACDLLSAANQTFKNLAAGASRNAFSKR